MHPPSSEMLWGISGVRRGLELDCPACSSWDSAAGIREGSPRHCLWLLARAAHSTSRVAVFTLQAAVPSCHGRNGKLKAHRFQIP